MSWGRFILRRLVLTAITLLIVSLVIFSITEVLPGDVAEIILGQEATPEALAAMRQRMGLDQPAWLRYLQWIGNAARGDLGHSLYYGVPIGPLLLTRLKNSLILGGLAFMIGVPLAILLGVIAGLTARRLQDNVISVFTLAAVSIPEFVTTVAMIFIFGVWLDWLPESSIIEPGTSFVASLKYLVLPVAALTLMMLAYVARMTRAGLVEVMRSDYIRTAFLKGLPRRIVVLRHALRNALPPTITVIASYAGWLIGGVIIVETVFAYPGMGRLLILAITHRDLPLLESTALVLAVVRVGSNFAADSLYAILNPRIRY